MGEVGLNLKTREQISFLLQHSLQRTRDKMKHYADMRRKAQTFEKGECVHMRLKPYRHISVSHRRDFKFHYGPFQVVNCIGSVA